MTSRLVVEQHGPAESMALHEDEMPTPGSRQVRIAVELAGVALSDVLMREGHYPGGPVPPYTPGWDVLGTVDAVGDGLDRAIAQTRVAALVFRGGYTTHALADERLLVPVPAAVPSDTAACLTLNYVTAWQMIVRVAKAQAGERLLVRGAAGGVGSAALDIARALGIRAWGVASTTCFLLDTRQ